MVCNKRKQLKIGIGIEMEHSHNFPKNLKKIIAKEIANDHINEFSCYYTKGLLPMERKLRRRK